MSDLRPNSEKVFMVKSTTPSLGAVSTLMLLLSSVFDHFCPDVPYWKGAVIKLLKISTHQRN